MQNPLSSLRAAVLARALCAPSTVYACDCIEAPARQAKQHAEIVFRGSIVGFRDSGDGYKLAVFQVSRVWKGRVPATFQMPAVDGDACFAFPASLLKIGNDLLVYAREWKNRSGYYPVAWNTMLVDIVKDMQALGPGRRPIAQ
jgi:hypothetical protein